MVFTVFYREKRPKEENGRLLLRKNLAYNVSIENINTHKRILF